jgi:hypothetical protein
MITIIAEFTVLLRIQCLDCILKDEHTHYSVRVNQGQNKSFKNEI